MGSTLIDRASAEQLSTFRLFGRLPGAELSDNDALLRICTGHQIALFNGVLDTEISDAEQLDDAIADTVGYFAERGLPFLWWTRPSSAPVVRDRLINAGFVAAAHSRS